MRLIDGDKLIEDVKNDLWVLGTVDEIASSAILEQVITIIQNQPEVIADDKLYDECLTKDKKEDAVDLFINIVQLINKHGYITISDVISMNGRFGSLMNWQYSSTHGWTRESVKDFSIKEIVNNRWLLVLGRPWHIMEQENEVNRK